jgi:Tol biopolymer transport system component
MPPQQPAIYVKLNGPGDAVKMTKVLPRVFSPAWSPDGRWIAALQDVGRVGVIVLIPGSGGQFRELARVNKADASADACVDSGFPFICGVASFGSALNWSRDGRYLFTAAETAPGSAALAIVRVSVETGEVQPMTSPPRESAGDFGPAVSPDGTQLAFLRFRSMRTGDIYVMPISEGNALPGRSPKQITRDGADVYTPAWTPDGRDLIFSSDRGGRRELWRVHATGGNPIRLAGVGEDALDVAVSQTGGTLVYNRGHYSGSLWKIPIHDGKGGEPVRVTATTARDKFSHFSPDGKRIAFESGRSGVDEIWVCDADGTNAAQLTTFGKGISGSPRWSPDGRMIAFDSNVAGSFDIYVIPSGGGRPVQLTTNSSTDAVPGWSRDSEWIYFTSGRTGRDEVWKVRPNGGIETQVTREGGGLAAESAGGRYLYFVRGTEDSGDLFRMERDGSNPTKVLNSVKGRLFTVFPKGIYFAASSPQAELRYLEFATGSIRVVAPLPGIPHADVSSDEQWALYPRPTMSDTNLMVVENFR